MSTGTTKLANLINPKVMGDMISAEVPKALKMKEFFKIDNTLKGKAGDTIRIPQFAYIGEAEDLAEDTAGQVTQLTTTEKEYTIKKVVKNVELTDEAVLSGYGDPIGEVTRQLYLSISDKIDTDATTLLTSLTTGNPKGVQIHNAEQSTLSYDVIVNALDEFPNLEQGEKLYLLVSKEGIKELRKDPKFIENNVNNVLERGVIGSIAGCSVVKSGKIEASKKAYILYPKSITVFLKRDVTFETDRNVLSKKTLFSVDEYYTVAIEDLTKIVKIELT